MKPKAYSIYKSSEINFLGDVPSHWDVIPIKFSLAIPITDGPHETPKLVNDGIPFISAEAIKADCINFDKKRGYISEEDHERFSKKYKPLLGDVYMVKSGATTGNVARVETEEEFNIWSPLAALRPNGERTITDFIFYFMKSRSFFYSVELNWSYGTQQNIGMGVIANLKIALPSIAEQKKISNYLSYKLSKIDTLIKKKKKLIEKLNEKRISVITQAVTKGLNPSAPMKDSGVDWLGEVPAHWEAGRFKDYCSIRYGLSEPPKYRDTGLPFIRATDVFRGSINVENIKRISPEDVPWGRKPNLDAGEIIVVRSGAYTGDSAIIPGTLNGAIAGFDMVVTVQKGDPMFVAYTLLSKYMLNYQIELAKNRAAQPHLNSEQLGAFFFWRPPLSEQFQIVDFIKQITRETDKQKLKTAEVIETLEEYRTALITSAVTGKIDVRDVQIPNQEVVSDDD